MSQWYFNPVGGYGLTSVLAVALIAARHVSGIAAPQVDAAAPRGPVGPAAGRDRAGDDGHAAAGAGHTKTKQQSATLVLLVDRSRSMTVADAVGGKTRWELLRTAVDDARPTLAQNRRKSRGQSLRLRRRTAPGRFLRRPLRSGQRSRGPANRHWRGAGRGAADAKAASGWPA